MLLIVIIISDGFYIPSELLARYLLRGLSGGEGKARDGKEEDNERKMSQTKSVIKGRSYVWVTLADAVVQWAKQGL